jgi:hypothetical protein
MGMKRQAGGPCLSAVFVDYDNIYLSLKRKSDEAAKRFAKESARWLRAIETGGLITATNAAFDPSPRRIVMNRCYGNPVPRRNQHDNSTDMSSFPFVRHHFLRAGFEVIDCPPLTAQLKNSADIRMVMDIRDLLMHETYFDEFIILSGDADFTPVLIRLRAHARRTVVFANDFTAAPYTAICDGEVREAALIELLLAGEPTDGSRQEGGAVASASRLEETRREILAEVVAGVRASATPVPLEALADRAVRALGHERTIATGWAGAGSFRELLRQGLPEEIRLTDEAPYLVLDSKRHREERAAPRPAPAPEPASRPAEAATSAPPPAQSVRELPETGQPAAPQARAYPSAAPAMLRPAEPEAHPEAPPHDHRSQAQRQQRPTALQPEPVSSRAAAMPQPATAPRPEPALAQRLDAPSPIQQSIARIQEACQAPPLAPQEYRALFEIMAKEISEHDLFGMQTLDNITRRAQERGIELRRDDVRFVLEVVSEADPWFEHGASADVFASRFRTFVVARCRGQGLNLTADELDLIDAWFLGSGLAQRLALRSGPAPTRPTPAIAAPPPQRGWAPETGDERWLQDDARSLKAGLREALSAQPQASGQHQEAQPADDFPRAIRNRLRG